MEIGSAYISGPYAVVLVITVLIVLVVAWAVGAMLAPRLKDHPAFKRWLGPLLWVLSGQIFFRKKRRRVYPSGAGCLSPEELEAACASSGFTEDEVLRLHQRFSVAAEGARRLRLAPLLERLPELGGPLLPRLPGALRPPAPSAAAGPAAPAAVASSSAASVAQAKPPAKQRAGGSALDFRGAVATLAVFHERAPPDDKVKMLFRLYDGDGDGRISRADLREMLELVIPPVSPTASSTAQATGAAADEEAGHAAAVKGAGDEEGKAAAPAAGAAAEPASTPAESPAAKERRELIERAVDGTFEEILGGWRAAADSAEEGLTLEQFALAVGDLASERCTAFF